MNKKFIKVHQIGLRARYKLEILKDNFIDEDILKGYFKNNELGLDTLNIQLSNKKYLDEHYEVQKDGTFKGKYLKICIKK